MASIEEKVEEQYKRLLDNLSIRHYGKIEKINPNITNALKNADSKSGGSGSNYPDIKLIVNNATGRYVPVMIEAKGSKGKLEKLTKDGSVAGITYYESNGKLNKDGVPTHLKGEPNYSNIKNFAVNGAVHYGNAILDEGTYSEVIVIGINGTTLNNDGSVADAECKAYYLSIKNSRIPKVIDKITATNWSLLKTENTDKLFDMLDKLSLTDKELEALTRKTEENLEEKIKAIHQSLYDDVQLKTALSTNEKLYLFCGLIMAGLTTNGVRPLEASDLRGNDNDRNNDGTTLLQHIESFLYAKNCSNDKVEMIKGLLEGVFKKAVLWKPKNGISSLHTLFTQVKKDIIPCLESNLHLDFTGKILNSLNDWVSIENDNANDVVLTPRYVTTLMAKMTRTSKDSFVWDKAMGSAGFLVSAMDIMVKDATDKIADKQELENKIKHIKEQQLLGVEILGNIYILAVLNMILMGDCASNVLNGDSHDFILPNTFPANVFLLNPPYSAPGRGFNFVEEALSQMTEGYACILIQHSAGSGQGLPYTKRILQNNTLETSIKMPADLFGSKASVSTYIFVFKVNRPHEEDDEVLFIDFSEDGYSRKNRKKSTQEVNLRDIDNAVARYDELLALVLGKRPKTSYYTETNGKVIKDTISLNGDDWLFTQHQKVDILPTKEIFRKTVADYFSFRVNQLLESNINDQKDDTNYEYRFYEFVVENILNVERTKSVNAKINLVEGNIPYVTRTVSNNGYMRTCGNADKINKCNCITIGGETGVAFYQPADFVAGNNICMLTADRLNEKHYLFLAGALNRLTKNYSYLNTRSLGRIKKEIICLPVKVDETGNPIIDTNCKYHEEGYIPDWDFMEKYIEKLEQECIEELERERIEKLEQYLLVTGLNDYELTDEDIEMFSRSLVSGITKNEIIKMLLKLTKSSKS